MAGEGFEHFDEMCTICHGAPGVEQSEIGKGLNPRAPDLSHAATKWAPHQLFWIVKHGIKMTGTPSFGTRHDDHEIWNIVAFLKSLPNISAEQYAKMKPQAPSSDRDHEHSSH